MMPKQGGTPMDEKRRNKARIDFYTKSMMDPDMTHTQAAVVCYIIAAKLLLEVVVG
jgi:hypothetical protein